MSYPGSEDVRERAYRIWENEGKPHGRDLEHWLRAERELFTGTGSPNGEKKKRSTSTAPKARGTSSRPRARKVAN